MSHDPKPPLAEPRSPADTQQRNTMSTISASGCESADVDGFACADPRSPADTRPWPYIYKQFPSGLNLEPHYSRHVAAMTAEGLHSKADIAAELAVRDLQIATLKVAESKKFDKFEYESLRVDVANFKKVKDGSNEIMIEGWRTLLERAMALIASASSSPAQPRTPADTHQRTHDYIPCTRAVAEANPECSEYRYLDKSDWSKWHKMPDAELPGFEYQFHIRPSDEPKVEAPGTIITWQRAQERVDAGLKVDVSAETSLVDSDWFPLAAGAQPDHWRDHLYRIPLPEPAAQPEPSREMVRADEPEAFRASGDCICSACFREYRKHPFSEHRDSNGEPYLNRLCGGQLVKL